MTCKNNHEITQEEIHDFVRFLMISNDFSMRKVNDSIKERELCLDVLSSIYLSYYVSFGVNLIDYLSKQWDVSTEEIMIPMFSLISEKMQLFKGDMIPARNLN